MIKQISSAELLDRIATRGIPEPLSAARALHAVLAVLGERLTEEEGHLLAAALPNDLGHVVELGEYDGDFDAAELYERARRRLHVDAGSARERADVVLRALGEALDDEQLQRLVRALPEPIGQKLLPPEWGEPPPHPAPVRAQPLTTLASGRPGSRHPLSEAAPPGAQAHSVVESDNPHGDTKLSSSRGTTQERLGESLAAGRPPTPGRPIAEAKDK